MSTLEVTYWSLFLHYFRVIILCIHKLQVFGAFISRHRYIPVKLVKINDAASVICADDVFCSCAGNCDIEISLKALKRFNAGIESLHVSLWIFMVYYVILLHQLAIVCLIPWIQEVYVYAHYSNLSNVVCLGNIAFKFYLILSKVMETAKCTSIFVPYVRNELFLIYQIICPSRWCM